MYAAVTGNGWQKQFVADSPCDSYTYYRGGNLELGAFIEHHRGKLIVGFVSYDLGYELYGIKQTAPDDLHLPDAYFLAFDHYTEVTPNSDAASAQLKNPFTARISRDAYHEAFSKIKDHIYEGNIYQINLTHRLEAKSSDPSRQIFTALNQQNNVAMAAYLEGPDFSIISLSPEKFISVRDGIIETLPIKGTQPRGHEAELLASEKERAELNMITDLLRNDLGKVCQIGSVRVEAHREIMKLKNISHTYSRITGQLRPDVAPIDALLSMFPGGSITGCPKKRAMEIINQLEATTRSAYCGSLVVIDEHANLNSSILIRTIIQKGKRLVLSVGGGIVVDSSEQAEYQETLDKAQAIIQSFITE
jgi:para-aminobenzoate synthetase component I